MRSPPGQQREGDAAEAPTARLTAGELAAAGLLAGMVLALVELGLLFVDVASADLGQLESLAGRTALTTIAPMLVVAPLGGAALALLGWCLLRPPARLGTPPWRRLAWYGLLASPLALYLCQRPLVVRQLGGGRWAALVVAAAALGGGLWLGAVALRRAAPALYAGPRRQRLTLGLALAGAALVAFALDRLAFPHRYLPLHWALTAGYLAALTTLATRARTPPRLRRPALLVGGYLAALVATGLLLEGSWTARFYLQRQTAFTARSLYPLTVAATLRRALAARGEAREPSPLPTTSDARTRSLRRRLGVATPTPNLLLITVDSAPATLFAWHGAGVDATPTLSRLAREGLVFGRAYAPSANTRTTLAAWHDGGRLWDKPRAPRRRLTGGLAARGYQRVCILPRATRDPGCEIFQRLDKLAWVDGALREYFATRHDPERPLFLQLHLMETHRPWPSALPEPGADNRGGRAGWRVAARRVDAQLARWLDDWRRRGLLADAVLVFSADHGESFGERGVHGHSTFLYDSQTWVPLLIWSSRGIRGARRRAGPVSNGWLGPTLLALAGADPGGPTIFDGPVYLREDGIHGLVVGRHKLIRDLERDTLELYDVVTDPAEATNLADRLPALRARLLARLRALTPAVGP